MRFADIVDDWRAPGSIHSEPRPSAHLWRWMGRGDRARRPDAIVVFRAPASAWPAALYLLAPRTVADPLLARVRSLGLSLERRPPTQPDGVRHSHDLRVDVPDPRSRGQVLQACLARAQRLNAFEILTALELVFRRPIPPGAVQRVVPPFRTSARQRARRDAQTDGD